MTDVERLGGRIVLLDDGRVRLDRQLDQIHEDHCVAMIHRKAVPESAAIERLTGCLRVRPVFDDWHAVFAGTPDSVRHELRIALGLDEVRCVTVPLEELFVELVGNDRPVEVA
ncbi:MAG: hypothetical protein WDO73_02495 [Ignavibacteriota bacterium]